MSTGSRITSLDQNQTMETMDPDDFCDCVHPPAVMKARQHLGDARGIPGTAEIFAVLGDPTRVRVLTALRSGELCVSDLAVTTGVNRSTISHQLRVLRAHRLVERRRDGKVVYYMIADAHIELLLDMASAHVGEEFAIRSEASA